MAVAGTHGKTTTTAIISHLFHSSGPNKTNDRRIGCAIRYIKPSMKQLTGDASLVTLVSGIDRYGHFKIGGKPSGRLNDNDFEL